jgi:bifunctional DNA-binding transcriptional regulator/antitoxin component of YhaV-PrlF toxin-antitoxin module
MPFGFIQSVVDLITPKPIRKERSLSDQDIIEAVNDCGEKRYIEIERNKKRERETDLNILLTKCKRLLSFVETTKNESIFKKLVTFTEKVRQALYLGNDIQILFHEFEQIENITKKSSKSFRNLSDITMMG